MTTPIPAPALGCAACHKFATALPLPHCETEHGCAWWICSECDAPNDGAGRFAHPTRLRGNHAGVLEWAAKFGIKAEFTNTPPKGKTA